MKRIACCAAAMALAAASSMAVDVGGSFSTEVRALLSDGSLAFNQEHGTLSFDQQVTDDLFGEVVLGVRYFNNPIADSSLSTTFPPAALGVLSVLAPLEIGLEEAYFTYTNFIVERLDLSVGKQRIPWGAADTLNPTDVLNPLDLSDPLDFGRKSASVAVSLAYALPVLDGSLQLVYEPWSPIARLNPLLLQQLSDALYAQILASCAGDSTSGWTSETVTVPGYDLSNWLVGARFAASVLGFDLSVSYVNRLDDLPTVTFADFATDPGYTLTDRSYALGYYREHVIGFDLVKDLGFVLAWGEVAVTVPIDAVTTITGTFGGFPVETSSTMDPYVKYTVGASQKIGPFYFNLQYNHGFAHERGDAGPARLQDYVVLRLELSLVSDTLKIGATGIGNASTLADAFAASDGWGYLENNYGVMGGLDLQYSPTPSMSITAGVMIFDGSDTATLGAWRDNDLASVKFSYSF